MKTLLKVFLAALAGFCLAQPATPAQPAQAEAPRGGDSILWYRQPAGTWEEALPVGNGHLGAMVFGGVPEEHIQFNEHTLWTGRPHAYHHEGAVKFLPDIRRLLQEGRQGAAQNLAMKEFMSVPLHQKAYQPCGDLWLDFPQQQTFSDFRRWLDLDTGLAVTEFRCGAVTYRREVFASYPDRMIVLRLSAGQPGRLDCLVRLSSPHRKATVEVEEPAALVLRGQVEADGIRFESRALLAAEGGRIVAEKAGLRVAGANALVVRLVAATSFTNFRDISGNPAERCTALLKQAADRSWDQLLQRHLTDHQALFRRVRLDLGRTPAVNNPTDQRLREFTRGQDPSLAALVFQYGRYLLIASSRAGGQPANLQGIWNESPESALG